MEIPYKLITKDSDQSIFNAEWAASTALKTSSPVALLVQKGSFDKNENLQSYELIEDFPLTREEAISSIVNNISQESIAVSTTGMISRELYEERIKMDKDLSNDFLTVGSMGHASQIALGISKLIQKKVICLDGDGAALMHLGGMTTIGTNETGNLLHIVLNNGSHDSVGGQPTVANDISLTLIAKACGYKLVDGPIKKKQEIVKIIKKQNVLQGMRLLK